VIPGAGLHTLHAAGKLVCRNELEIVRATAFVTKV
jgi:hypothetical protein